jgi:hypothetical protein
LRQAAEIRAAKTAGKAFLAKPVTAVRLRFSTNDPTPWPPETPAGENPMPGALIDYVLPANAKLVTLEIVEAEAVPSLRSGQALRSGLGGAAVIRHYTSAMAPAGPHPALDPVAYNKICMNNPGAPDCGLPLYWPAPPVTLGATAGAHRFSWDLHYDPIGEEQGFAVGGGAVPHRTFPGIATPWAPPGNYIVRLTVDGATYTQPLTLRLDPRVKTPAVALTQVATLTKDLYGQATAAHDAYVKARALITKLDMVQGADVAAFKAQVDSLAPPQQAGGRGGRGGGFGGGGGRGGRGGAAPAPTLTSVSAALVAAAAALGGADVAPTAARLDAAAKAKADAQQVMLKWTKLSTTGLASLNLKRKAAGQPVIPPM